MAFSSKFIYVVLVAGLCLLMMDEASGCNTGHGCFFVKAAAQEIHNRKVLAGLERNRKGGVKGPVHLHGSSTSTGNGADLVGWELRKVPSGPDPLHHNGGSPKKPQTP